MSTENEPKNPAGGEEAKQFYKRLLLIVLFSLMAARLIGFAENIGTRSLQLDFAAYFTAGESLNRNLSPYKTHIHENPPIWDGNTEFTHSRFLYPPLAAALFKPFALLPYKDAKYLWTALILFSVAAGVLLAVLTAGSDRDLNALLFIATVVAGFYPVLVMLDLGQIDGVTFLLMMLVFRFTVADGRKGYLAGLFLAGATLLKLHCAFALPFLLARRRFKVMVGWVSGCCLLAVLSLVTVGWNLSRDYIVSELPRINQWGWRGSPNMRLPAEFLDSKREAEGMRRKDGTLYLHDLFPGVLNATLVNHLRPRIVQLVRTDVSRTVVSVFALALFAVPLLLLGPWEFRRSGFTDDQDGLLWWQAVLTCILLTAPMTWVTNAVWILPSVVILVSQYRRMTTRRDAFKLGILTLGVAVTGIPDYPSCQVLVPAHGILVKVLDLKYVLGELLVLVAVVWMLMGKGREDVAANKNACNIDFTGEFCKGG